MQRYSRQGTFALGASVVRTFGSHRDTVLRVWFTDDAGRLPVQIETAVPILGTGMFWAAGAELTCSQAVSISAATPRPATF